MQTKGLVEVKNPNELFLNERSQEAIPGSAIIVTNEGTRPFLVEIQALVGTTPYPTPRRVANGVDTGRVLQILAVLENFEIPDNSREKDDGRFYEKVALLLHPTFI